VKRITLLTFCFAALLLTACESTKDVEENEAPSPQKAEKVLLFKDSMSKDWQSNWFLDGKNAVLKHRDGGLAFITTASKEDKKVNRAAFDAQHAVLWTKREFEGDIRISYTFSKHPDSSWQKLIYVQARGIGQKPYVEDIHAWHKLRDVARMDKYFKRMNLVSLSLRDQIRCKRYPVMDLEGNRLPCESKPRGENKGLPNGGEFHVLIEKRKKSILLRIKNLQTGEFAVDHTWDLSELTEKRNPKFVEKGRIGLRLMGGHKINFRNFKVEQIESL